MSTRLSTVVACIEAPVSMAFTTWAYLTPYKYQVGQFIDWRAFIVSLAFSMLHILLELNDFKDLLVSEGSVAKAAHRKVAVGLSEQDKAELPYCSVQAAA